MNLILDLDRQKETPLYRQIYEQIRTLILEGKLPPGFKLPPTRQLAIDSGIARVSVTAAYAQLQEEGYVVSKVGAGTFVSEVLAKMPDKEPGLERSFEAPLSRWGQRVLSSGRSSSRDVNGGARTIDFGFGRSFPHIFPYDIWRRLLARYLSTDDTMLSHYGSVAGFYPLREAVAGYLKRWRGVSCTPEQVIIVSGMQQALDLLARLFLTSGDEVLVETPGYTGAFDLFCTFGANLIALPVDDNGFPVELIPENSNARLIFVTPSNQFPKGGTMPLERRLALLRWARRAGALILEDDYDGELRYRGHPVSALQGLDQDGRVIYLGTFSKVLFPTLRLGYVVLSPSLSDPFLQAMQLVDRGAPTLTQAAVADFIGEGHFEKHLRLLRSEYGQRRRILVETLVGLLGDRVTFSTVEAGLHVMLFLPSQIDEQVLVREAGKAGVGIYPGAPYHLDPPQRPSVLLGFSGLEQGEIVEGVTTLAHVLRRLLASR